MTYTYIHIRTFMYFHSYILTLLYVHAYMYLHLIYAYTYTNTHTSHRRPQTSGSVAQWDGETSKREGAEYGIILVCCLAFLILRHVRLEPSLSSPRRFRSSRILLWNWHRIMKHPHDSCITFLFQPSDVGSVWEGLKLSQKSKHYQSGSATAHLDYLSQISTSALNYENIKVKPLKRQIDQFSNHGQSTIVFP